MGAYRLSPLPRRSSHRSRQHTAARAKNHQRPVVQVASELDAGSLCPCLGETGIILIQIHIAQQFPSMLGSHVDSPTARVLRLSYRGD